MGLILGIDTSVETALVYIAKDGAIIQAEENNEIRNHGSFLQPAIHSILQSAQIELQNVDAIAVVNGPGSYTGLRVGLASAKGLCYTLQKPLITISTLKLLAFNALCATKTMSALKEAFLLCPMIDARRMEVFTATYNNNLDEVIEPNALVVEDTSFKELLETQQIVFNGNGSNKVATIISHPNAIFIGYSNLKNSFATLAENHLHDNLFANVAYSEPHYVKDVYFAAKS